MQLFKRQPNAIFRSTQDSATEVISNDTPLAVYLIRQISPAETRKTRDIRAVLAWSGIGLLYSGFKP